MVAVAALGAILPSRAFRRRQPDSASVVVTKMLSALVVYQTNHGAFPSGNYAEVCRALFGVNPNKQKYFEAGPKGVNAAGEIVDFWGTPLRLDFSPHPHAPRVQSAGKNRVFEPMGKDSDDVYSWQE